MSVQVNYRTDYGDILAAQAQGKAQNGESPPEPLSEVRVIKTAGGMDMLVAAVIGGAAARNMQGDLIALLREQIFSQCQRSTEPDPAVILRDALHSANQVAKIHPELLTKEVSILAAVISGRRLYLAQQGLAYAYLIRGDCLIPLTKEDHAEGSLLGLSRTISLTPQNRAGADKVNVVRNRTVDPTIDTNIYLNGENPRDSLDLQSRDGLILSPGRVVEKVLKQGNEDQLPEDFLEIYHDQPPVDIADHLLRAADTMDEKDQASLVVIKADEAMAAYPLKSANKKGFFIGQIGIIALILIISMALGLAAAYAVPAVMNPKPIANTGSTAPVPSGFISILLADGVVQANVPGQSQVVMAPGAVLTAKPGTVVETTRGTTKLQMIDGTNIYVGNNTDVQFQKLADPKVNLLNTELVLSKGLMLLDASHSNKTTSAILIPSPNTTQANGLFMGVSYLPDMNQVTIDCMEGLCNLKTSQGSQNLNTGQSVVVTNGVIGPVGPVDLNRWQNLCDSECPVLTPNSLPTPTLLPTDTPQPSPVPYLGGVKPTGAVLVTNSDPQAAILVIQTAGGDSTAAAAPAAAVDPPVPSPVSSDPPPVSPPVVVAPTQAPPMSIAPPPTEVPPPKVVRAENLPGIMTTVTDMVKGEIWGAAQNLRRVSLNWGIGN